MPESLTAPARDALAAATELADLLHETDASDWPESRDDILAIIRRIDAGRHVLAAVLDAHKPAAGAAS